MKITKKVKKKERLLWIVKGCCLLAVPGWLFYRNVAVVFGLFLLLPVYLKYEKKEYEKKEKQRLNQGFADALTAFSAALEAGYSAENALGECAKDLTMLYPEDEPIRTEISYLQRQLRNNRSLEQAFADMAVRTGDTDILCFSEVFEIAKRSGGDLIGVIKATERNMAECAEVRREIRTVISAKRMEANIMNLMPCGIILYFMLCDPMYLSPLYEGIVGRLLMTVVLVVYLTCVLWSHKITEIEI